jgi:7,8-dihydropterin-6-yl-methyl-4-(beta-D-ribofuranosyl)aminobenzene 5'-phosphate synthase
MNRLLRIALLFFVAEPAVLARADPPPVATARVLILSTMLADQGIGEWGFAALVEANGRQLLFDTGNNSDTVLRNAEALKIDLSGITDVVLSHFHGDHTGGLLALRRQLMKKNPAALSRAHIGPGFFWLRTKGGTPYYPSTAAARADYEATGGKFIEHAEPTQLMPGVWVTGRVPRRHPEHNYPSGVLVETPQGKVPDDVQDELSLVIDSVDGLVVVTGCGHAGVVNTLEAARAAVRPVPVRALIGGLHLFEADEKTLEWTGSHLKALGVANLIGAHCTGIEAVYRLRALTGLDRRTCVVGSVGASYDLDKGIDPGRLAR